MFVVLHNKVGVSKTEKVKSFKAKTQDRLKRKEKTLPYFYKKKVDLEQSQETQTLLNKNEYDLKNLYVRNRIKRGLFYYLIDLINVFGLANLSSSTSQYIQSSPCSKRILSSYNYEIVSLILNNDKSKTVKKIVQKHANALIINI